MSLGDVLAELKKEYVASMPDKVAHIESLWQDKHLDLLETEFHKLKGTGKTYGFPEISELGERIERICQQSPQALSEALPKAQGLLLDFCQAESQGRKFDMVQDMRFVQIEKMLSSSPN